MIYIGFLLEHISITEFNNPLIEDISKKNYYINFDYLCNFIQLESQ